MIRIGTRDSALAVWQARLVQAMLAGQGVVSQLVFVKTQGDIDSITPLYELGVEGVFTKALDTALLKGEVDIAVHSMKDVPVVLAEGLRAAAVLKRGNALDVFVPAQPHPIFWDNAAATATIATCSIRRKAQWLRRYPHHTIESIRGNIDTRLKKLQQHHWAGAIFAAAGLERLGLMPDYAVPLTWMVPAPAQGALLVVCRSDDKQIYAACNAFNDEVTAYCTALERAFLHQLKGGCSAPVSALAVPQNGQIVFKGQVLSPDGKECFEIADIVEKDHPVAQGHTFAEKLLANGAGEVIRQIRQDVSG